MIREPHTPRADWQAQMESIGFGFHSIDGLYWQEAYAYRFSANQIDLIDDVTMELHHMAMDVVDELIRRGNVSSLGIDPRWQAQIESSWRRAEPPLLGRMDLVYDGTSPPKLLEYNADTATSLIESSLAQWNWLCHTHPEADQFNSLHEKLIEQWQHIRAYWRLHDTRTPTQYPLHFIGAYTQEEDAVHLDYLLDTAIQAGFACDWLNIEDVGWDGAYFVDHHGHAIRRAFKLYPWEWMLRSDFCEHVFTPNTQWVEPAWKMLLSNKGFLAHLWQAYPKHPNLLPAAFTQQALADITAQHRLPNTGYVRKPLCSREGSGVQLHYPNGDIIQESMNEPPEGWVYQTLHPLPKFGSSWTVLGSWMVGHRSAGLGIREDCSPITKDTSHFVPHYFC